MQITSRFPMAVHALLCIHTFGKERKVTSDFIASSVNTNPVIIRKILGQLQAAGLIEVSRGAGGSTLARDFRDLTLLDVYKAVSLEGDLFRFHESPNPKCPVGRGIHRVLDGRLSDAQRAMEESLAETSLGDLVADLAIKRK